MPSRKNLLKQQSPYKGTGRYLQYLRCPCCGKLARGQAIGSAGTHKLSVSRCIRKLPGYRTGWEWGHERPSRDHLEHLAEALRRALAQVDVGLGVWAAEELLAVRAESVLIRSGRFLVVGSQSRVKGGSYAIKGENHVVKEERSRAPVRDGVL